MSLVIEDGSGVPNANTYASVASVTSYLTDRNRQEENGWVDADTVAQEAAVIAATDYIEGRWRERFMGCKGFTNIKLAKAVLTLTLNPTDTSTVTLGGTVYTFNTVLGGANSVLIGVSTSISIDNFILAVLAGSGEGTLYGTGTVVNPDATVKAFDGDTMIAEAVEAGNVGNLVSSLTTVTGATWSSATLLGGSDVGRPQPLSFPRSDLFDRDGVELRGIPDHLKQAVAEYAVRAILAKLQTDPELDAIGGEVLSKREKVGPIEQETTYAEGSHLRSTVRPYPAADRLVREFLRPGNTLVRI